MGYQSPHLDLPLDNLFLRLFMPWKRYRSHIAQELQPTFSSSDFVVTGLNTVNPIAWQRGKLRQSSLKRACDFLGQECDSGQIGLVMMHHPPEHDTDVGKRLMKGADAGLRALRDCGADIILCGHLHNWRVAPFRAARSLLLVQAGTGLSNRLRAEPNDLNVLRVEQDGVTIERHAAEGEKTRFTCISRGVYRKKEGVWNALP